MSYHYTQEEAEEAVKMLELERDFKNKIASLRLEPRPDYSEFSTEWVYDTGVPQDEFDIKERYNGDGIMTRNMTKSQKNARDSR